MKLTIKRATTEDAGIIGYIHSKVWVEDHKDIADPKIIAQMTPERRASRIAQNISNELWEYYLIKLDGTPIGFLVLGENKSDDSPDSNIGEISALCIVNEHQNHGYEARTLDYAIERLLTKGYQTSYFWIDEGHIRMQTMLSAREFSFTGVPRSSFIGTFITHYRYEKHPESIIINDDEF